MKLSFAGLLVAATFVAASGAAQAQGFIGFPPVLSSGTGTVQFSDEGRAALAVASVNLAAASTIPAVPGVSSGGGANAASFVGTTGLLGLNFSALTINGNRVTSLASPDSFLRLRRSLIDGDGSTVTSQYSVYLTGFEFDLSTFSISAHLYASSTTSVTSDLGRMAVFTASEPGVAGGTQGEVKVVGVNPASNVPQYLASGSLSGSLRLNTHAGTVILGSLGLGDISPDVSNFWRGANWGAVSFVASSVPEPSTWALFGIGALAMGMSVRRRPA